MNFVSRAGNKLDYAMAELNLNVSDKVCADLGCSTGGFTDCLIQRQAAKVYSVDTGYGVLDYKLRTNPKVIVMERTNAMHVSLPESVNFISIDVGWTRQSLILPHALSLVSNNSDIVSLVKPHYEAKKAYLTPTESQAVLENIIADLNQQNIVPLKVLQSPILGEKGKNVEYLIWLHID